MWPYMSLSLLVDSQPVLLRGLVLLAEVRIPAATIAFCIRESICNHFFGGFGARWPWRLRRNPIGVVVEEFSTYLGMRRNSRALDASASNGMNLMKSYQDARTLQEPRGSSRYPRQQPCHINASSYRDYLFPNWRPHLASSPFSRGGAASLHRRWRWRWSSNCLRQRRNSNTTCQKY